MSHEHKRGGGMETYENAPLTGAGASNYGSEGKPTFGRKLKNHYKRFWWLHLTLFILIGLLLTLLLTFVGFPRIAQDGVNNSKLEAVSQGAYNPTPTSIDVDLQSIATNDNVFTPTLDSFNASFFLGDAGPDKPFGYLQIPSLHATKEAHIHVNQTMQIADMDQFIAYNKKTLGSETYEVGFKGRTALHEGSLPVTHVNYQKLVTVAGLNGLKGFKILNFTISLQAEADGTNMRGQVFLPNPSNFTLTLGNLTMSVYVDKEYIGLSKIDNAVLKPGNNTFDMTSATDQTKVLSLITSKYKDGILPLSISGNTTVYNGQHLKYYEEPLASNILTTNLDVGKALAQIGINITDLTSGGGSSSSSSSSASSSSTSGGGLSGSSSTSAGLFGASSTASSSSDVGILGASSTSSSSSEFVFFGATPSSAASSSSSGSAAAFPTKI